MTAKEAKSLIKSRLCGFLSSYAGVVEEATNLWNAEHIGFKWNAEATEFEIKCSKSDLVGEIRAALFALNQDIFELRPFGTLIVMSETALAGYHWHSPSRHSPTSLQRPNSFN